MKTSPMLTYDSKVDTVSLPLPSAPSGSTLVIPVGMILKTIEQGGGGAVTRSQTYGLPPAFFAVAAMVAFGVGGVVMVLGSPEGWSVWRNFLYVAGLAVASDLGFLCISDYRYARRMARAAAHVEG